MSIPAIIMTVYSASSTSSLTLSRVKRCGVFTAHSKGKRKKERKKEVFTAHSKEKRKKEKMVRARPQTTECFAGSVVLDRGYISTFLPSLVSSGVSWFGRVVRRPVGKQINPGLNPLRFAFLSSQTAAVQGHSSASVPPLTKTVGSLWPVGQGAGLQIRRSTVRLLDAIEVKDPPPPVLPNQHLSRLRVHSTHTKIAAPVKNPMSTVDYRFYV